MGLIAVPFLGVVEADFAESARSRRGACLGVVCLQRPLEFDAGRSRFAKYMVAESNFVSRCRGGALLALLRWRELGTTPGVKIYSQSVANAVFRSRPLASSLTISKLLIMPRSS